MKYFCVCLLVVIYLMSFSQTKLEIGNKFYYGANHYLYKDTLKGKMGETQITLLQFTDSLVTSYIYHRFIYNLNDLTLKTIEPIGKIYVQQTNYELDHNILRIPHHVYKYFIFKNENKDTLSAFLNKELLKYNVYDTFTEISIEEANAILKLQ